MKTIESILRFDLRPWLTKTNLSDDYYNPQLRQTRPTVEGFNSNYKIDFGVIAFSSKIKYYQRLIDNEITIFLNSFMNELVDESNNLIAFRLKKERSKLKSLISEINDLISSKEYDLSLINSKNADFRTDRIHKESTFIFQYMLTAVIKCYLEIQYHYAEHIHIDDKLEITEIYSVFLNKLAPEKALIQEVQKIIIEPEKKKSKEKATVVLSFKYTKLLSNSNNITDLFNSLKKFNFIAQDTTITEFKHVFSGIQVNKPIVWTGGKSNLTHLIKLLYKEQKILTFSGNSVWKIVCICFVDINGNKFDEKGLRDQKQPKLTKLNIEKAAKLLK